MDLVSNLDIICYVGCHPCLLAKLSTVALEAKYHTKCLVDLYNCARKAKANRCEGTDEREELCLQNWYYTLKKYINMM